MNLSTREVLQLHRGASSLYISADLAEIPEVLQLTPASITTEGGTKVIVIGVE